MIIDEGTIFRKKNIVFKQTNMIDTRINSHPLLIPIDIGINDNKLFFFTLSSQIQHYTRSEDRYYLLKKSKGSGLHKTSIVDLKYVYCSDWHFPIPDGHLAPDLVSDILDKFKRYEDVVMDQDCKNFLSRIE